MLTTLAASFNEPDKVSFYNVVLFLHILSAIVAFGITFTYPLIFASLTRNGNVAHLAWWHRTEVQIERFILSPAATVLLACGIYMAADGPYGFKSTFVSLGLAFLIVIMGLLGSVIIRSEVKAAEIAERAIAPDGSGELGPDYQRLAKRMQWAGTVASLLVVATVFLMVTKLGAHS
jgi:uncharacterized membrane protein